MNMYSKVLVLLSIVLISISCGNNATNRNPLSAYNFMMTEFKPAEQQEILKKSGYSGVALVVNNEGDFTALDEHINAPLTSSGDFKITAVLTALEITTDSIKPGNVFLEKLFSRLEKTKTIFWPIILKGTTDERVAEALVQIAGLAAKYNVHVVLYPQATL